MKIPIVYKPSKAKKENQWVDFFKANILLLKPDKNDIKKKPQINLTHD